MLLQTQIAGLQCDHTQNQHKKHIINSKKESCHSYYQLLKLQMVQPDERSQQEPKKEIYKKNKKKLHLLVEKKKSRSKQVANMT